MKRSLKHKLIASSALALSLVSGYGRRAYTADCATGSPSTYLCTGTYTSTVDITGVNNANVSTGAGFYVNVTAPLSDGINITGDGALGFTDAYGSSVTGTSSGLYIRALNDDALTSTPGSITVYTAAGSVITGINYSGIRAFNSGAGDMQVTVYGDVHGNSYTGIALRNDTVGGNIVLKTGDDSHITGGSRYGLYTSNYGVGDTSIDASGEITGDTGGISAFTGTNTTSLKIRTGIDSVVTGTNLHGIYAHHRGSGAVSVTTDGDVSGGDQGIRVINRGTGAIFVTANGNVTGGKNGILVDNYTNNDGLTIQTGADSVITGNIRYGIYARNHNTIGTVSVTVDGRVTGDRSGLYLFDYGTGLTIDTGADSVITGNGRYSISARNNGTGALMITADGEVTGYNGIAARNYATTTDMTIRTGINSIITGSGDYSRGILATNYGTGALSMTIDGQVTGFIGIYADNSASGSGLTIETGADSVISSVPVNGYYEDGISALNSGGALSITISGEVNGGRNGIRARNYATTTDMIIQTGADSIVRGGTSNGIRAIHDGTGTLSITADGQITGYNGIDARNSSYGTDLTIQTGIDSVITGTNSAGIFVQSYGTGALSVTTDGDVTGSIDGLVAINSSGTDMIVNTGVDSVITGGSYSGVYIAHDGTGGLSMTHHGTIRGTTGIYLRNSGGASTGIVTDGTIEGTGGTAIEFYTDNGASTTATPVHIAGGRVIGNVVDKKTNLGLSRIFISGDFISEGSFYVSDFTVDSGVNFTLSSGNVINAYNGVDVDGRIYAGGGGSYVSAARVNATGRMSVVDDLAVYGDFTNNGITDIATGKTLTVNAMSAGTGQLNFGFNTAADHAQLRVISAPADLTGQTLYINVTGVTGLANNEQALLVTGLGDIVGGPGGTRTQVGDSSVLWDFDIVDGTNSITTTTAADLFLIAKQAASIGFLSDTQNNENAGNALMDLQPTADPELSGIVANMNGASTQAQFNTVLESVQAVADASEAQALTQFTQNSMDIAGDRMNRLRHFDADGRLMTASLRNSDEALPQVKSLQSWAVSFGDDGDATRNYGLGRDTAHHFLGGAGSYARQDARGGIDGYRSVSGGAMFGIDTASSFSDKIFGLAFAYNHAEIKSFNANRAENVTDGFLVLAYGSKSFNNGGHVELQASYAQNSNSTTRHDVGGTPGLTAKGDFTSQETGLRAAYGHEIMHGDWLLTPRLSVDWLHYVADDYTETSAGGANLNVKTQSLDLVEIGGEVRAQRSFRRDDGSTVTPGMHAGYYYNVTGDPLEKTSRFSGGGPAFATQSPDPTQHRVNAGVDIQYHGTGNWDYSLSYDLDLKEDYYAHNLLAKASMKF